MRAIRRSFHLRRKPSGTRRVIARAKSALMIRASACVDLRLGANADRPAPFKEDLPGLLAEHDIHAHLAGDAGHGVRHRPAPADRVIDPVLVFQVRQDREEARAAVGRHSQILRLKRKRHPDSRVAEIAAQLLVEREPGPQRWQQLEHSLREQVAPTEERTLQTGLELPEFVPVVLHEPAKVHGIVGTKLSDRTLHPVGVRRGVQFAPGTEDQVVLGVEPDELHLLPQVPADGLEDRFQDLWVEEKRGADVEPKSVRLQGRRAPADSRLTLQHGHAQTRPGQ